MENYLIIYGEQYELLRDNLQKEEKLKKKKSFFAFN
jgi:hypothetical protein